jgi:hypothetical protein
MIEYNLANIKAGMVLAKPVVVQKQKLLGEGTVLEEKHFQIFKTWGIRTLWVEGEAGNQVQSSSSDETTTSSNTGEIEKRFIKCDMNNPVIIELKQIVQQFQKSSSPKSL